MDEKPKSIWKKSWRGTWSMLMAWLGLMIATLIIVFAITLASGGRFTSEELKLWAVFVLCTTVVFFLALFARWLCCWRNFKRFLFGLACFATLIALFYAEEDWRGKHDWEKFKREWEVKGERFDWQSVVPPPVPDDENFALSPVWIAEIRYGYLNEERTKTWYGDRIYSQEVSNFVSLLPVSTSTVVGTNMWKFPNPPENSGTWASSRFLDLKPLQSYYRNLGKTNPAAQIIIAPQPQTPAQDVLLALSKFDLVIEQLRRDSARPYSRFPIQYDGMPAAILLPHLAAEKRCSQVLQLRAIAELQNKESEKALADVKLMLRLTDASRTEPFLICHLVRIAILQITLQPIWEGLAEHKWSDAQLAEFDSELSKLDFLAASQSVQKSEIFFSAEEANYLRLHRDYANQFAQMGFGYPTDAKFKFAIYRYMPGGWFYQSALKNGRMVMEYLPAVNHDAGTISPSLVRRANVAARNGGGFFDPLDTLRKMFNEEDFMGNFVEKIAASQSYVNLARTSIALERYHLAHGNFPDSLDAFTPQFMEKIPHDIINGQPLHYRRTDDGQFVLYSVGWNETDDGGVVVLNQGKTPTVDISQGDWVWRYPQK